MYGQRRVPCSRLNLKGKTFRGPFRKAIKGAFNVRASFRLPASNKLFATVVDRSTRSFPGSCNPGLQTDYFDPIERSAALKAIIPTRIRPTFAHALHFSTGQTSCCPISTDHSLLASLEYYIVEICSPKMTSPQRLRHYLSIFLLLAVCYIWSATSVTIGKVSHSGTSDVEQAVSALGSLVTVKQSCFYARCSSSSPCCSSSYYCRNGRCWNCKDKGRYCSSDSECCGQSTCQDRRCSEATTGGTCSPIFGSCSLLTDCCQEYTGPNSLKYCAGGKCQLCAGFNRPCSVTSGLAGSTAPPCCLSSGLICRKSVCKFWWS